MGQTTRTQRRALQKAQKETEKGFSIRRLKHEAAPVVRNYSWFALAIGFILSSTLFHGGASVLIGRWKRPSFGVDGVYGAMRLGGHVMVTVVSFRILFVVCLAMFKLWNNVEKTQAVPVYKNRNPAVTQKSRRIKPEPLWRTRPTPTMQEQEQDYPRLPTEKSDRSRLRKMQEQEQEQEGI